MLLLCLCITYLSDSCIPHLGPCYASKQVVTDNSFAQKGSGGNLVTGCTHQAKSGTKVALACLGCDQMCHTMTRSHGFDVVMDLTWLVRVEARRVPPAIDV